MAAGWLRHLAGDAVEVRSAGSEPGERINPVAVEAMAEVGIDITGRTPQKLEWETAQSSDVIITMGCGDACPIFPGKRYEDWKIDDPAGQDIDAVRPIRDEIKTRIENLLADLVPALAPPPLEKYWWAARPPADPLLEALAVNPALPEALTLRLIHDHGAVTADGLARRASLTGAEVAAMLSHPMPWVRAAVGSNTSVDPEVRLRLLDDPDPVVRARMVNQREIPLPEATLILRLRRLDQFLTAGLCTPAEWEGEVLEEVYRDPRLRSVLARHPDERFRLVSCFCAPGMDDADQQALLHDRSATVRTAAAERIAEWSRPRTPADLRAATGRGRITVLTSPLSPELIGEVLATADEHDLIGLALNRALPAEAVEALTAASSAQVRRYTAQRHDLSTAQAVRLGADPDPAVRTTASVHPALTEAQRAAIDIDLTALVRPSAHRVFSLLLLPDWLPARPRTAAEACSANPLLRRWAAQDPQLPDHLAATLAEDPDDGVRLLLALHHPAAPPDLLLRAYLDHEGFVRRRLLDRPRFPTIGLARFAAHPDPGARRLVARDPEADPATVQRLLGDPDETVRTAMAGCPRLPPSRIVELLDDPEFTTVAAANPALPTTQMHRLLAGGYDSDGTVKSQ
jgi:protein-tyrosine-phosphatase